jgi:membrane protein implicated in regulation of membrane protease activity
VEWVMAIALVVIGLSCLTMSANWFGDSASIRPYLNTLFQICLWAGGPVVVVLLIYFLFLKKRKDDK